MRTKNTGSVSATMSVAVPSGRSKVIAIPRPSTSASGAAGLPLPLEKRTRASIGAALEMAGAAEPGRGGRRGERRRAERALGVRRALAVVPPVDVADGVDGLRGPLLRVKVSHR